MSEQNELKDLKFHMTYCENNILQEKDSNERAFLGNIVKNRSWQIEWNLSYFPPHLLYSKTALVEFQLKYFFTLIDLTISKALQGNFEGIFLG